MITCSYTDDFHRLTRIIRRSSDVLKPRNWQFELLLSFEICRVLRQHCWRGVYQIQERPSLYIYIYIYIHIHKYIYIYIYIDRYIYRYIDICVCLVCVSEVDTTIRQLLFFSAQDENKSIVSQVNAQILHASGYRPIIMKMTNNFQRHSFSHWLIDSLLLIVLNKYIFIKRLSNYTNPGYGLSLVDTLWNAGSYRQPLEQEGNPMT